MKATATLSIDGGHRLLSTDWRRLSCTPPVTAALFWILWYGGIVSAAFIRGVFLTPYSLAALAVSCGSALLMWIAIARFAKGTEPWSFDTRIVIVCIASVLAALVHSGLHMLLLGGWAGAPTQRVLVPMPAVAMSAMWILIYIVWSTMLSARFYADALVEREHRIAELHVAQLQAQMEALRYQVNPHFLFNTLNSVSALVLERRIDQADQALGKLADFFRMSLEDQPLDRVDLAEEFAAQRRYLDIERLRFGNRIVSEFDLPSELENAQILPFLIQPLIENSIKHGLAPGRTIHVRLAARRCLEMLELVVADDGAGSHAMSGEGVGLTNVRKRLHLRYGEAASMEAAALPQGGYAVKIVLPFEERPLPASDR